MAEGDECSSLVVPATKEAPSMHVGYLRGPEAGGLSSADNSSSCEMLPTREESGGKEEREYERGEREMGERGEVCVISGGEVLHSSQFSEAPGDDEHSEYFDISDDGTEPDSQFVAATVDQMSD